MKYKFLPFIPVIGIPLTAFFTLKGKPTGLDNIFINISSAIFQAISIITLVSLLV